MKQLTLATFLTLAALTVSGCATALKSYRPTYDVGLLEIERPASPSNRFGPTTVSKSKSKDAFTYQDQFVDISWGIQANGLAIALKNKCDNSIKIIWDEASFVDELGKAHPLIHGGTKFVNKYEHQRPTVLPRRTWYQDVINSADQVVLGEKGWEEGMFLPLDLMTEEDSRRVADYFAGKTFKIVLPIQLQETVNDYTFLFKVNRTGVEFEGPTMQGPEAAASSSIAPL